MELPGGAVGNAANNAYARIGRAGPGLAGPGKIVTLNLAPPISPACRRARGTPGVKP
jgi:hypothetical protein